MKGRHSFGACEESRLHHCDGESEALNSGWSPDIHEIPTLDAHPRLKNMKIRKPAKRRLQRLLGIRVTNMSAGRRSILQIFDLTFH